MVRCQLLNLFHFIAFLFVERILDLEDGMVPTVHHATYRILIYFLMLHNFNVNYIS